MPDFVLETEMRAKLGAGRDGKITIAGVDEVGRGPWAGPVVACAAVLDQTTFPADLAAVLDDSKKLSAKKRAALLPHIRAAADFAIAEASVEEIDRLNILQASLLAMRRAVEAQRAVAHWSQAQIDDLCRAMVKAGSAAAADLARLAVDETGIGLDPDAVDAVLQPSNEGDDS